MNYRQLEALLNKIDKYEEVLDEIREYLNELIIYVDENGEIYFKEEFRIEYYDLLEILDKVKKL